MAEPSEPYEKLPRAHLKLGASLALGSSMALLDTTVVAVAGRTLATDLHASLTAIAWVSTAYLITMSATVPLSGWAMERFGGRRVWFAAVAAFLVGSVLCGAAWSIGSLVAFRVLQGIGGGLIQPVGQALLGRNVGPRYMARVMAVISVPMALMPALGPVVGGLVLAGPGWRWLFFVNVPIGVAAMALVRRHVPAEAGQAGRRLDVTGLALISPGFAALVYGLSAAGEHGGFAAAGVWVPVAGGVLLLAAYVAHSLRTDRSADRPALLDLRLFRDRPFRSAMATATALGGTMFGAMFLLPLYFQQAHGASALRTGLWLAPQGLGTAVATLYAGRMTNRLGARVLVVAGLAAAAVATVPFLALTAGTPAAPLVGTLFVRGLGLGLVMAPLIAAGYATLDRADIPKATALFNILNRVGGSLGTALLAVLLQRGLGGVRTAEGVANAYAGAFGWALGCTVLALVPAALLPGARMLRAAVAAAEVRDGAGARTAETLEPAAA